MQAKYNQNKNKTPVYYLTINYDDADQRIDNFLISKLKGVPKSHIYRLLRKGEVRVNKKRVKALYRLKLNDIVRIPPVSVEKKGSLSPPSKNTADNLTNRILYEDENFLIINKPTGFSVHAGNTVRMGVVEILRALYPKLPNLELAHRLDSETSGCLILAKKKRILREVHQLLREGNVKKIYWAITKGHWKENELLVDLPLLKSYQEGGKHVVRVYKEGKSATTLFRTLESFSHASLMEATLFTGRTHQIRVHAAHRNHPIAGDDRYGEPLFNKEAKKLGLNRMFLHAREIDFVLPSSNQRIRVIAPLDSELDESIKAFSRSLNEKQS